MQFRNFVPKKIVNLPDNLVSLHFGEQYEGGVDKEGRLFIWDKHSMDANLDPNQEDSLRHNIVLLA